MFKYDPLEITIATGSYDTPYEAFALGVFVNKENPLSQLTLQQVAAIFGCCPGKNVRTWASSDSPVNGPISRYMSSDTPRETTSQTFLN